MDRFDGAYQTFVRHFRGSPFATRPGGFLVLELGPRGALFTAPIARAFGAEGVVLVDFGAFASEDLALYRKLIRFLGERGHRRAAREGYKSVEELLSKCSARYLTEGLASLRGLPAASVDFLFSTAVLQKVRRSEILDLLLETRRLLRPDGFGSHVIDLRDSLDEGLNHLRLPEHVWESDWVTRAGRYTNRRRFSEWLALFGRAGFKVDVAEVERWDVLPTPRSQLDPAFREFSHDDLCVKSFRLNLRPAPSPSPPRDASAAPAG